MPLLVLLFIALRRAAARRGWTSTRGRRDVRRSALYSGLRRRGPALRRRSAVGQGADRGRACRSASPTPRRCGRIVLPQAFRTVISPLGSLTIAMIKNSAIVGVSLLALPDLLEAGADRATPTPSRPTRRSSGPVGYLLLTEHA